MKVLIATPLRSYTGNRSPVEAEGATLADLLADLDRRYPGHPLSHDRRAGPDPPAHARLRQRRAGTRSGRRAAAGRRRADPAIALRRVRPNGGAANHRPTGWGLSHRDPRRCHRPGRRRIVADGVTQAAPPPRRREPGSPRGDDRTGVATVPAVFVVVGAEAEACHARDRGSAGRDGSRTFTGPMASAARSAPASRRPPRRNHRSMPRSSRSPINPPSPSTLLDQLVAAGETQPRASSPASMPARLGAPALFARRHFDALRRLSGDRGGKALLAAHRETVVRVPFAPAAIDVDTPDDYRRCRAAGGDHSAAATAARTRSGVNGMSRSRTPMASKTAFAIAAGRRSLRRLARAEVRLAGAVEQHRLDLGHLARSAGSDSSPSRRW